MVFWRAGNDVWIQPLGFRSISEVQYLIAIPFLYIALPSSAGDEEDRE